MVKRTLWVQFKQDDRGAVMVEMTIAIVLFLTLTLGFVDFGYALYQWNAATKAVQVGARLASISDPIVSEIREAGPASAPGDPIPVNPVPAASSFDYRCDGSTSTCPCVGTNCVSGAWVAANFNHIYAGDDGICGTDPDENPDPGRPGMCDFFPALEPENVVVRYAASGLGYQTRPNGSIPTITVSLQDVTFHFFFLSGLLGFDDIEMPSMRSTVTGEDMRSTAP